jgi:predicted small lipoprotein YifL
MKRLIGLLVVTIVLTSLFSCGPRRYKCGPYRRCEIEKKATDFDQYQDCITVYTV